jgi:hypothetical protein
MAQAMGKNIGHKVRRK